MVGTAAGEPPTMICAQCRAEAIAVVGPKPKRLMWPKGYEPEIPHLARALGLQYRNKQYDLLESGDAEFVDKQLAGARVRELLDEHMGRPEFSNDIKYKDNEKARQAFFEKSITGVETIRTGLLKNGRDKYCLAKEAILRSVDSAWYKAKEKCGRAGKYAEERASDYIHRLEKWEAAVDRLASEKLRMYAAALLTLGGGGGGTDGRPGTRDVDRVGDDKYIGSTRPSNHQQHGNGSEADEVDGKDVQGEEQAKGESLAKRNAAAEDRNHQSDVEDNNSNKQTPSSLERDGERGAGARPGCGESICAELGCTLKAEDSIADSAEGVLYCTRHSKRDTRHMASSPLRRNQVRLPGRGVSSSEMCMTPRCPKMAVVGEGDRAEYCAEHSEIGMNFIGYLEEPEHGSGGRLQTEQVTIVLVVRERRYNIHV